MHTINRTQLIAAFTYMDDLSDVDALFDAVEAAMTLRPLVKALRIHHCSHLRNFGLRYLDRDMPADVVAGIQQLMFVNDQDDLERKHALAQAWFWDTLGQIEQ
jgi:hypothetical protein